MILTVTPNAAIDKTYRVEDFCLDRVHRPSETLTVAGGKGINVARVYRTLGGQSVATGFLGGLNGQVVKRALADEGIPDEFVRVRGESRICIAIVDPKRGTQTEVNETGPDISLNTVNKLLSRVASLLEQQKFDFLTLNGSLPPGTPPDLFASLIEIAEETETRVVLDTSGAALREGLREQPWMVKPNRYELESVLGRPVRTRQEALEAANTLFRREIEVVAVTLGAEGAILVTEQGAWASVPPVVPFASAVASGDAFIAAFLWAWTQSERPGDAEVALRLATGAGAANAAVIGAGFCTRESIFAQAERAQVERLSS